MQINLNEINIIHNQAAFRFEAHINGYLARLDYRLATDSIIFSHTGTPPALQGQGIAGKLVQTGLEYARENKLKVVPQCSYVAAYIRKHPEYQPLLQENAKE
jgi:hypothetical protein